MTKTERNNTIAILIVALLWILLAAVALGLGGCAGQGLKITYQDGDGKLVQVDTDYQVENGFTMERDGDGYKIELGSATTHEADQAGMFSIMGQMLLMIQAMYGVPVPQAPVGQE